MKRKKILILYTGGTIGMMYDGKDKALKPFDFKQIFSKVPEIKRLNYSISVQSFEPLIDSSNMQPAHWLRMAKAIGQKYDQYDGFVILHGSDTMAYTASALSFLLENLNKPVVLTGSQLPVGEIRTDAKENLITALEIAAASEKDKPVVPEVSIYFDFVLYRGNRAGKYNSEKFEAFESVNYPELAHAGVHLRFNKQYISRGTKKKLKVHDKLDSKIGILKLFPGLTREWTEGALRTEGIKAVVLETFGAGNAPTDKWLTAALQAAINRGLILVNVTQCGGGMVEQGRYATSKQLEKIGVVSGLDMTTEAAVAKLMFLLPQRMSRPQMKVQLQKNLRGELTV